MCFHSGPAPHLSTCAPLRLEYGNLCQDLCRDFQNPPSLHGTSFYGRDQTAILAAGTKGACKGWRAPIWRRDCWGLHNQAAEDETWRIKFLCTRRLSVHQLLLLNHTQHFRSLEHTLNKKVKARHFPSPLTIVRPEETTNSLRKPWKHPIVSITPKSMK